VNGIASFYLWPKDRFDEYSKMARLVPPNQTKLAKAQAQGAHLVLMAAKPISAAEVDTPKYRNEHKQGLERYERLENYRKKYAREPFKFDWAGAVILDLAIYLKEVKQIDLGSVTLAEYDGDAEHLVMNKEFKDKYLSRLDPAKFSANEMGCWFAHYTEQREDAELKLLESKRFDDKEMKQLAAK
jgi:hypothetical protein